MFYNSIPTDIIHSVCYKNFKKLTQLRVYLGTNKYTNEELLKIFNEYFNYGITLDDITKCFMPAYGLKKAYVEPMVKYIHSEKYKQIIKTFIDNYPH